MSSQLAMFVVKYIPEWFPGAGFQRWASKGRRMVNEMMEGPWETIKKELVSVHSYS